ncbi:MAG: hypothetical protein ACI4V7_12775 [Succinivibrionaceae bacterium]
MLEKLNSREVTGNDAIALVEKTIGSFCIADQEILKAILQRKLTIGLSKASFDKLIGEEATKEFTVTLAHLLDKVKGVNPIDGTWYASRKMDGCRCVAMVKKTSKNVSVDFISRQGKPFTTLDNMKEGVEWLVRDLPTGNYVFDGELCIVDENGDEHFDWIMKEIKKKNWTIKNPCYQIFDFVTLNEFEMKTKSAIFSERYKEMQKMFKGNKFATIKLLEQERITSQEDFDRWSQYVEDGNWEGFMLRRDVEFEVGRTKNLLKIKKFDDAEYVVKDIEIAEMTTSEPGKGNVKFTGVKSLIIEHKGNDVNVGSGLSREQRIEWMKNPSKIIGKTVTIKYFEITKNKQGQESLRFPTLKYVYENGRNV